MKMESLEVNKKRHPQPATVLRCLRTESSATYSLLTYGAYGFWKVQGNEQKR